MIYTEAMRLGRWLLLIAILAISYFVGRVFLDRKETLASSALPAPKLLESGLEGQANDWVYTQSDGDKPRVTVRAKKFKQIKAPSVLELDGVQLQLFHKDSTLFDLVQCERAEFDIAGKTLFSEGEVDITMGVPAEGNAPARILKIHSSGVHFASDSGKAWTDRAASFEFGQGNGSAVGAEYSPLDHQLHMLGHVKLHWKGDDPKAKPMEIEAGEAFYREAEAKVVLMPWSKLKREGLQMEAGQSVITLDKGVIRKAESDGAHGVQQDPARKVEFAADHLVLDFADKMKVSRMNGKQNGKLISTTVSLKTTVTSDTLALDFEPAADEPVLTTALAKGKSVLQAEPVNQPAATIADTRVLRSDVIHLKMRPGGQEIDRVETDGPGTVEFLPNRAGQPKRFMKGDQIWIAYGAQNRIQSFRSINASTRTEKAGAAPMLTDSKELLATFSGTGELARLDQNKNFHYQEGERRATAERASLEQANEQSKDLITLDGAARAWDPTGSVNAERILLNQKSGDYQADGRVTTTHVGDGSAKKGSAMLASNEVLQGRADHLTSRERNQKLRYDGNASVWQGANRVQAEKIDIDRAARTFEAHGKVVSQFADKNAQSKAKTPGFTLVRAPELTYSDETRLAYYTGGASMTRPELSVTGQEIKAYLNESSAESSLDKAFADGGVKIISAAPEPAGRGTRMRTGTSDHAEYYSAEQKVLLEGGDPTFVDSIRGKTRGQKLTWWANNDRLLVDGAENRPADTLLRKKVK